MCMVLLGRHLSILCVNVLKQGIMFYLEGIQKQYMNETDPNQFSDFFILILSVFFFPVALPYACSSPGLV